MQTFELDAQPRELTGTSASRRLRKTGFIPAIIYGAHKDPQQLTIKHSELVRHLEEEAFYSHILDIKIEGQGVEKAVLKDVQRHPSKPFVLHIDLQRVSADEKLHMNIPLHFINEENCVGVKQGGGKIQHQLNEVEITCLPKDLPEYIEVDMQGVDLNQVIHLSDLKCPEGVELVELSHGTEHDQPVVSVHAPRGAGGDDEAGEEEAATDE